jgi:molybdenum cofactor cytidylyltransferase
VAGLRAGDSRAQGVVFALSDQPLVDSQTIDRLVGEFYRSGKGIIIPVYRGRRGNPVIFAMKYKDELLRVTGDTGGRAVIQNHPEDILEVAVDSEGVCIDIDTAADYNKLIAKR